MKQTYNAFFEGKKAVFLQGLWQGERDFYSGAHLAYHPSMWPFCGYNEIQEPRRKNVVIDYERLQGLLRASSYDQVRSIHKGWVEEYL